MKESRWAVSTLSFSLGLILFFFNFASAGIVIDDFNTTRDYPPCCGEYGAYYSFKSNIVQNGSGTLVIGGTAGDNGGFYRDKQGETLWNLLAQSNLMVTAKVLEGNQATNFHVVFRDANWNRIRFTFAFTNLNSSNFTILTKPLFSPDWEDVEGNMPFDYTKITALDVYGEFTEDDSPLRLELDSIETQGPSVLGMLHLDYRTTNEILILSWSTNLTNGFLLQSSTTVLGGWGNETNIVVVSNEYRFAVLMTNETRFYRLLSTSDPLGEYPVLDEEEFWESLPSPDSLMMRNEANLAVADAPVLTDFPIFPSVPPMPPMPDERLGLAANRAMVSEMQTSAMNSGVPPPPSGSVIPTNSYIDVAAHSVIITNLNFNLHWTTNPSDAEKTYLLNYSSHTGGSEYYQEMYYTSHVAVLTNSFPWVRTGGYSHQNCSTIWDPASAIWTNGAQVYTQGSASSTNIVSPPAVLLGKFVGLYNCETYGDINPGSEYGFLESMYRRQDVQLDLHVGRAFSNNWRTFVLLSNAATRIDSIALPEFDDWYDCLLEADMTQSAPISFSNITVLGQGLNIDNSLFVQLVPGTITNVTPAIPGASNYLFDLQVEPHHVVNFTRAYHPMFLLDKKSNMALSNLQARFNGGSMLLATDNDRKLPDTDPIVVYSDDPDSWYRCDDVPFYVEFRISEGPTNLCDFTRTNQAVFPQEFSDDSFFVIKYEKDLAKLVSWGGANIKQVKSILLLNSPPAFGCATNNPEGMILTEDSPDPAATCVHEWGHICGLTHRNVNRNGTTINPGPGLAGIMCGANLVLLRSKVNRYEVGILEMYFRKL